MPASKQPGKCERTVRFSPNPSENPIESHHGEIEAANRSFPRIKWALCKHSTTVLLVTFKRLSCVEAINAMAS